MAGRAAAPLPRSARSQPPALRAPLSLLLSPALGGGGGGSSLLGSLAPVIRGAGLGAALPAPPPPPRGTPAGERRASPEPTRPPAPQAQAQGRRGPGPYGPDQFSPSERRGVPATHRLRACGRTQACVIHVPRDRPARAKGAPCLLAQSPGAKAACLFPTQFTPWGGGAWMLGVKPRLRPLGAGPGYSPPPS